MDIILEARRQWLAGRLGPARLNEVEQAYEFRLTSDGLLADLELRRAFSVHRVIRYDWPHTCLAYGLVTTAAWPFIRTCAERGVATQEDLYTFLREPWVFPLQRRHQAARLVASV